MDGAVDKRKVKEKGSRRTRQGHRSATPSQMGPAYVEPLNQEPSVFKRSKGPINVNTVYHQDIGMPTALRMVDGSGNNGFPVDLKLKEEMGRLAGCLESSEGTL